MTDVNCLTSEHTTTTTPQKIVLEPPTSPFVLRAPPSAKSKLILQNMEEVLNSVKQKHREKHKRKREEKRRAAKAEADSQQQQQQHTDDRHVLREKTARENGVGEGGGGGNAGKRKSNASPLKNSTPLGLDHHQQTSITKHFGKPVAKEKPKAPTNVFELMMNARNRSLGTNSTGLQSPPEQVAECVEETVVTPSTKRKQLLREWNEKKGGAKRRIADDARGEYIEQQMEQRAKRLKKMLTQQPEQKKSSSQVKQEEVQPSSAPAKRGRGRPRTRHLSVDAIVSVTPESPKVVDADAVQFLAKLSSPTKKRDSLLGYFSKVVSPNETPKRRPRVSKTSVVEITTTTTSTSSGRPRRTCATKSRCDNDLEPSPIKDKQTVKVTSVSVEIIDLDDSNSTPKKLAPLFVRQLPKPSPDPTALRARQEFLQSGVPEKLRQEQQRQRCFEQYYEDNYELFPSIAHVEAARIEVRPGSPPFKFRTETDQNDVKMVRKSRPGSITCCSAPDFVNAKKKPNYIFTPLPSLENKRSLVKNWKSTFDRFPTFKCYNQMREKYRHFSAIDTAQDTQPMGESFVVTRRTRRSMELLQGEDEAKPPALAPNGELLFTEKYKPLLFEQVLVNLTPVQELRDFLSNWNGAGNRNSQTSDDNSFIDFGNDSSSVGATCNTMVLLGPCSSGKTNAVFALANDMNFNVLEINAGMRRTGKKLMQELQEATQSHQIRKEAKAGAALVPTQQLLQKLQQNGSKAKRQQGTDEDVRKSLILIEDADILFENTDAGFTDAIYTLAASSKRPVIIVATDPNCAHLQRLIQQNKIIFQPPNALNISRFLAVLALMENCPIELDELISLYLYNNQNLRKTLMELQFFIQSGGDAPTTRLQSHIVPVVKSPSKSPRLANQDGVHVHQHLFEFYTSAQNVQHFIPFPVDFRLLRLNLNEFMRHSTLLQSDRQESVPAARRSGKRKSCSPKKAWLSTATTNKHKSDPLQTLASFYEHLSCAALLDAGLQLEGCNDRIQPHLSEQLAHSLVERAVSTCLASKNYTYNLFDKTEQRLNLMDNLGSYCLRTTSARFLDFEPAMRAICRSEKQRAGLERRSSRFYHYLRNHTTNNVGSFSTDLYDAACHVLQPKQTESADKSAETFNP